MIFHQRLSMQSIIKIFWPAGSELLAGPVVSTSEALVDAQRELQATRAESERRGERIALLEAAAGRLEPEAEMAAALAAHLAGMGIAPGPTVGRASRGP